MKKKISIFLIVNALILSVVVNFFLIFRTDSLRKELYRNNNLLHKEKIKHLSDSFNLTKKFAIRETELIYEVDSLKNLLALDSIEFKKKDGTELISK